MLKNAEGYILIDTGYRRKRKDIEKALNDVDCKPGTLKLIVLTHQDFDHTGNAAFLREKYNTRIAMHKEDTEAVERGDMLWNRKGRNIFTRLIFKVILVAFRVGKFEKFTPDIYLSEGDDLSSHGLNATVLHLPGHSKGSIGILTDQGDLFCGDLFMNGKKSSLVDKREDLDNSITKLKNFDVSIVYPGHGSPFPLIEYLAQEIN